MVPVPLSVPVPMPFVLPVPLLEIVLVPILVVQESRCRRLLSRDRLGERSRDRCLFLVELRLFWGPPAVSLSSGSSSSSGCGQGLRPQGHEVSGSPSGAPKEPQVVGGG